MSYRPKNIKARNLQVLGNLVGASGVTNDGVAGTSVTLSDEGNVVNHVSTLSFSNLSLAAPAAATGGLGAKIFTFPSGNRHVKSCAMNLQLFNNTDGNNVLVDVGVGSILANDTNATLGTSDDDLSANVNTATLVNNSTGVALTGFSLATNNLQTGTDDAYLNIAGAFAGNGVVTASGSVTISWDFLG